MSIKASIYYFYLLIYVNFKKRLRKGIILYIQDLICFGSYIYAFRSLSFNFSSFRIRLCYLHNY